MWVPERVLFLDPSTSIRPLTFLKKAGKERIKSSGAQSQNGKEEGALERLQITTTRITICDQTYTGKVEVLPSLNYSGAGEDRSDWPNS